jgi:cellobiose dehydrogenase (acceptor)
LESSSHVLEIIKTVPGGTINMPPPGIGLEAYLRSYINTMQNMSMWNHWVGTTKIGESCEEEDAVVDTSTRACGMRTLHVADEGIISSVPTTNPQGMIIVVVERAAEIMLGSWECWEGWFRGHLGNSGDSCHRIVL